MKEFRDGRLYVELNGKTYRSKYKLGNVLKQVGYYFYNGCDEDLQDNDGGREPSPSWTFKGIKFIESSKIFRYQFSCDNSWWYRENTLIINKKRKIII